MLWSAEALLPGEGAGALPDDSLGVLTFGASGCPGEVFDIFCRAANSAREGSISPCPGAEGEGVGVLAPPGDVLAGDGAAVGGDVLGGPLLLSVGSLRPAEGLGAEGLEDKALEPPPEVGGGDGEGGDDVFEDEGAAGGEGEGFGAGGGEGLGAGLGAGVGGSEPIYELSPEGPLGQTHPRTLYSTDRERRLLVRSPSVRYKEDEKDKNDFITPNQSTFWFQQSDSTEKPTEIGPLNK